MMKIGAGGSGLFRMLQKLFTRGGRVSPTGSGCLIEITKSSHGHREIGHLIADAVEDGSFHPMQSPAPTIKYFLTIV
jgi:hypothetical protein